MKDGPEGDIITSALEQVTIGEDSAFHFSLNAILARAAPPEPVKFPSPI